MNGKLEYYPGDRPIFDLYDVKMRRSDLGRRRFKIGGYLIIDQTSLTTIDINTGALLTIN